MNKNLLAKIIAITVTTLTFGAPYHATLQAQTMDGPLLITLVAEVYQTKRATAEPFLRGDSIDAAQFIAALEKLSQGFNSTTTLTKLLVLTTGSAMNSVAKSKDVALEAAPWGAPDGQTVNPDATLSIGEKELKTSTATKFGGTIFLGALPGTTKDSVQVVFIRILKQ